MEQEYLILKDAQGNTIKVSEEQYKNNPDLFNTIIEDNGNLPSWLSKYKS